MRARQSTLSCLRVVGETMTMQLFGCTPKNACIFSFYKGKLNDVRFRSHCPSLPPPFPLVNQNPAAHFSGQYPFWAFLGRKLLVKPYAEIPSSSHIPQKSHRQRRRKIALASKKNMGENEEEEEEEGEINP